MRYPSLIPQFAALLLAIGVSGCNAPPLETPASTVKQQTPIRVAQNLKNKVDVLFMVDNSNSMDAMQDELRMKFFQFFKVFSDLAAQGTLADLHIGVVTSDYGAGAVGAPGCQPSPGGQQGKLQALGADYMKFDSTCKKPNMANFIQYEFAANGMDGPNNLPAGQDLIKTFQCMASVGANGCGFEHQLESTYAALHNNLPENAGFLRTDALLAVVYVTNEDDASAPPDTNIFDRSRSQYGYEDSYRQTRYGVLCGNPPALIPYGDSMGDISPCIAAPNPGNSVPDREYDIGRYIDFFTQPSASGGVKDDPLDVVLVTLDAPATPFITILSNPGTPAGTAYAPCSPLNDNANPACTPVLQHSCVNPANSHFFGDPAVRLNTVVSAAMNHNVSSICADDYSSALMNLGHLIVSQLGLGCIPAALPADTTPGMMSCMSQTDCPPLTRCLADSMSQSTCHALVTDCVVEDVTIQSTGMSTTTDIPECQCQNNVCNWPCWKIEPKDKCTCPAGAMGCVPQSPDGVGLTIDRNGMPAPDHTTAQVFCSTQQ
jgi:hypothetical protein